MHQEMTSSNHDQEPEVSQSGDIATTVQFRDVTRRFGKKVAVDRLSLDLRRGELFALLGPNGAGKTTTIKMLIGLLRPCEGTITIAGHDIADPRRHAARFLGHVPDQPFLYDKLSGYEFLRFVGEMRGMEPETLEKAAAALADEFQLHDFMNHLTETYSHGMKQRIVFASALLHDPAVLVIDEPMVGLDPRSVRLVKDLLRRRTESGTTVFMSTHTLSVAEQIADRIGILCGGRIRFLGTLNDLKAESHSRGETLEDLFLELTGRVEGEEEEEESPSPGGRSSR